ARGVEKSRGTQAAEETQFLAPAIRPEEDELERSLRPRTLDDFIGQDRVKEQLAITPEAARARPRGRPRAHRGARPPAPDRPARPGQDEPRLHRPRGARRRAAHGRWA